MKLSFRVQRRCQLTNSADKNEQLLKALVDYQRLGSSDEFEVKLSL
jgi:hypothetical protein